MINQEAKQHLARKLNIDYSDISNNDLWSDTDLQVLIQLGIFKAWDYKPWPFTQGTQTTTTVDTDYYDHPDKLMNRTVAREKDIVFQDAMARHEGPVG